MVSFSFFLNWFSWRGGITACGTAVLKGVFVPYVAAGRTAHGREIPSAMTAGFLVLADFIAAVIAKKARFFTH
jgi:hypothetical protein